MKFELTNTHGDAHGEFAAMLRVDGQDITLCGRYANGAFFISDGQSANFHEVCQIIEQHGPRINLGGMEVDCALDVFVCAIADGQLESGIEFGPINATIPRDHIKLLINQLRDCEDEIDTALRAVIAADKYGDIDTAPIFKTAETLKRLASGIEQGKGKKI